MYDNHVDDPVPCKQEYIIERVSYSIIGANNVRNIWYMYIYMYICMYGTSIIRAPLHRLCTGPHAIFCAEKSALKNNCDSMF